jgi:DNA repair photolyase
MKPIYAPKGAAKEYGDYAINIYTGCPHRCYYCFAPSVLHRTKEVFHSCVAPRKGIVEAVKRQLESEHITGKLIHLCFVCDPYPLGCDSSATREIIKAIKASGDHVQILTKNGMDAKCDFDLLDSDDWFGVTYAGYPNLADGVSPNEPGAGTPYERLNALKFAHVLGIHTWVSCEPVLDSLDVLLLIEKGDYIDKFKIGKLNYHPSEINWKAFGEAAETACERYGRNYYIKESLRKEMEADHA